MSLQDLASDAQEYREVQRAAAHLRLVTDRRLERGPTPQWVVNLANERADQILGPAWVAETIARLDVEARRQCPCQCHGYRTQGELDEEARDDRNLRRAGARLQKILDERLGRTTRISVLDLAAEEAD